MTSSTRSDWFRPAEQTFYRRVCDIAEKVTQQHIWERTDFLTPREQRIVTHIANQVGCVVAQDGGYPDAERKRALVMPDNWYPETSDYHVEMMHVVSADGHALTHGGVLGSLLGLGIERRVLGDISANENQAVFAVSAEMAAYVQANLRQVGRSPVDVTRCTGQLAPTPPVYASRTVTVASMRVDAVLAAACRLSRSQAQDLILRGHVTLNFVDIKDTDTSVVAGDVFSVRGFGRVKISEVLGMSKKDKFRIEVGILNSNLK